MVGYPQLLHLHRRTCSSFHAIVTASPTAGYAAVFCFFYYLFFAGWVPHDAFPFIGRFGLLLNIDGTKGTVSLAFSFFFSRLVLRRGNTESPKE